ncbi:MAG TPA: hypothetical protein VF331_18935 [Polyangiales bacterium]
MRGVSVLAFLSLMLGLAGCAPAGSSAYVSFNIPPDSSCTYTPTATGGKFLPEGEFDITGAATGGNCNQGYRVNLLVNSELRANKDVTLGRTEPNVLQIDSAQVRLMSQDKRTIAFDRVTPHLPNPFLTTANNSLVPTAAGDPSIGIASLMAIPKPYAKMLDKFKDGEILAEIQIFGTTTGDESIEFKPFVYPIQIVENKLYVCLSSLVGKNLTRTDIYGKDCPDNAGADGRICIDDGC